MLSESLHPNRLVAGSFASPSRDLLQIGFRLYPLPNNAITGKAGDIGFIQRNGWFGRSYRQTVKLSDFVSHPHVAVKCGFSYIPEDMNLFIMVSLTDNTSFPLFQVSRSFFADSSYMLSFSVLCSCVCSRLISPSVSSWHKQDNTLMHQSPGHIQRRTPYNF